MKLLPNENTQELINGLIKIGEVSSVDYAKGTARVVFDDEDSLVSNDLPVLQRNTIANMDYVMPDIGEDVLCVFLPNGIEEGFILGSFYAGEITPPESSGNKRTVVFADDTKVCYDREKHQLSVKIGGTSFVADGNNVDIIGNVRIKGNVEIDGPLAVVDTVEAADVKTSAVASVNAHTHTSGLPGEPTTTPNG